MNLNESVFVLDEGRRWFLEQGRIDPMTRERFRLGDRVVVCSGCDMVFLESTWQDCNGCVTPGCGKKRLKKQFLKMPPQKRNEGTAAQTVQMQPPRVVLRNGETSPQRAQAAQRTVLRNAGAAGHSPVPPPAEGAAASAPPAADAPVMVIRSIRHD